MTSDIIIKPNPICPECSREIANFYDREYALISHPFSSDPENKVCIYCAMRIQNAEISRELEERCTYLNENLSDLFPALLRDSEFRRLFQRHLRCFGAFGSIVDSGGSYSNLMKSMKKLLFQHIYPEYAMDFYLRMTEEDFAAVQSSITEYILSLLKSASSRIAQTAERMRYSMPKEFDIRAFLSNREYGMQMRKACHKNNISLTMTEQEQAFLDEIIRDCCSILDEESVSMPDFGALLQSSAPKETDVGCFLRNYKNGSSDLKLWYFTSDDGSQCAVAAFPDDCTSRVDFYDWFNTSLSDKYIEPRYVFSKEVIERIDIPADQTTARMKQAALQTVLGCLKDQDESQRTICQSQLEALEKAFQITDPWNESISEMNETEYQDILQEEREYEEAIYGRRRLRDRDIRRHYSKTKGNAFESIYNENLTLEEKGRLIDQFIELQKMIWHDQYLLPMGTIDFKPYRDSINRSARNDADRFFGGTDLISMVVYFHHWRIQRDQRSLDLLLDTAYTLMDSNFVFDFEQYVDYEPYKLAAPILSDRLPFFDRINRCCSLLERYLAEVVPVIERIGGEELSHLKCARLDALHDMPSQAFSRYMNSDSELFVLSLGELSFEEMRHASLSNMELSQDIREVVDSRLAEQAKAALRIRMETIVAKTAVTHIGKTLDVVSLLMDLLSVLSEVNRLNREEAQQLLKVKGRLRRHLMTMEEISFVEPEVYEEHLRSRSVNIIDAKEHFAARFKAQFKYFMGSLDLIGAKDVEELMEQRRRFVLQFSLDPELDHNMNRFLDRLTEKIQDSLKDSISYCARRQQIQDQLSVYPVEIHESVISTLATGEELYYKYIDGRKPMEGFDYSCIAIMYFQALENLLNRVIYTPYKEGCLDPNKRDIYRSFKANQNFLYIPWAPSMSIYFSKSGNENTCCLKDDMTLGSFPFLFKNVMTLPPFEAFLKKTFHAQSLDAESLYSFGENLRIIALRRNDAAHGSKVLDSDTVTYDRDLVYNENKAASLQIKAAMLQFLSMFQ